MLAMSLLFDSAFLAHLSQCKASAKQQVNSMIDAIYAKVLLYLELWLNKHESNHSLALHHNEPTGEQMQSNDSIKSEIDSDSEENVTDHNLPGESSFEQNTKSSNDHLTNTQDHPNKLQNEVSLSNTINTESIIKQELDDEEDDGEEIDHECVAKCKKGNCTYVHDAEMGENRDESSDTSRHTEHSLLENNQIINPKVILPSPSPTNPINTKPLIQQQCFHNSSIPSIPFDFTNNSTRNDIAIDEQIEEQSTQIQIYEFSYNDKVDYDYCEGDEVELLNQPNCTNRVCDLDHHNNNNHLNNDVPEEDEDETNLDDLQFQINVSTANNTQMNIQIEEEYDSIERTESSQSSLIESTQSTSGVQSTACKRIPNKVFGNFAQSNMNPCKSGKCKSNHANKNMKKVKRTNVWDDDESTYDNSDESMVIKQEKRDANNAIGEESTATECTTNQTQPQLETFNEPNRHLQCSHCHKSFDCNSKLQAHLRVHTGERPFQCEQCDKRFSQLGTLTRHQLIHQNMKHFQCDYCGKQFNHKVTLNIHLQIHSGERPHQCGFCGKTFAHLSTRNSHEQAIHLHVKPYRCKQCGHTATKRVNVIAHIRMAHFGLPRTIKQQQAHNIIDNRDPRELIEKV